MILTRAALLFLLSLISVYSNLQSMNVVLSVCFFSSTSTRLLHNSLVLPGPCRCSCQRNGGATHTQATPGILPLQDITTLMWMVRTNPLPLKQQGPSIASRHCDPSLHVSHWPAARCPADPLARAAPGGRRVAYQHATIQPTPTDKTHIAVKHPRTQVSVSSLGIGRSSILLLLSCLC